MSTYLQLCQYTGRDSGTIAASQIAAVTGQTGRAAEIVALVAEAWRQIQAESAQWSWMRAEWSYALTSGTDDYTPTTIGLTRHRRWITQDPAVTLYLTATGVSDEGELSFLDWPAFQRLFLRGSQTDARPTHFTVRPRDRALVFGPQPDAAYTAQGDYIKSAQTLSANSDEPECPSEHHELIKWKALLLLDEFDEAPVSRAFAELNYRNGMTALRRDCLPELKITAAPIA